MSSLLAHEDRLSKAYEKAFQMNEDSSENGRSEYYGNQGRGGYHGRGHGYGRGRGGFNEQNQHQGSYEYQGYHNSGYEDQSQFKSNIQCRYCKKFGHKEAECWSKQSNEQKSNFAQDVEEESKLFMTHSTCTSVSDVVWFLDCGCSNHMAG